MIFTGIAIYKIVQHYRQKGKQWMADAIEENYKYYIKQGKTAEYATRQAQIDANNGIRHSMTEYKSHKDIYKSINESLEQVYGDNS